MRRLSRSIALLLLMAVPAMAKDAAFPDRVLGKADAKVTVTEYASLTCIHCSAFNETAMPVIKKEYVATGKVKYIYRDFPTDAMALKAAMLARCLPEKRYFGFIDTLFRQRDQWINAEGNLEPMKQLAALAGLGGAKADACLADKKLEESLLRQRLQASNLLNIDATPTIIIDGEKFTGEHTAEEVRKVLDKAVARAAKKKK